MMTMARNFPTPVSRGALMRGAAPIQVSTVPTMKSKPQGIDPRQSAAGGIFFRHGPVSRGLGKSDVVNPALPPVAVALPILVTRDQEYGFAD